MDAAGTRWAGAPYVGPVSVYCNRERGGAVPPDFCVQWQVVNNSLRLTLEGQAGGWIALGIAPGPSMFGMCVYVCVSGVCGGGGGGAPPDSRMGRRPCRGGCVPVRRGAGRPQWRCNGAARPALLSPARHVRGPACQQSWSVCTRPPCRQGAYGLACAG
jgi:hypothetical protein